MNVSWRQVIKITLARVFYLDGAGDVAAGVLKNVLESLAAGLSLVGNAATDQVALCVGRDLTRDPDLTSSLDGLGLEGFLSEMFNGSMEMSIVRCNRHNLSRKTYVASHGCA